MRDQQKHNEHEGQDLPPFVKTWKQFYLLLIGWLIILIVAFYIFTIYTQ